MNNKIKKLKCTLLLGTECGGNVSVRTIFRMANIKMPICENHFKETEDIYLLFENGYDLNNVLKMPEEWRRKEALTIRASEFKDKNIPKTGES